MFVSTVVTVLVHELGHALAAARYKVLTFYAQFMYMSCFIVIVFLMN